MSSAPERAGAPEQAAATPPERARGQSSGPAPAPAPTLPAVLREQRKAVLVAVCMAVASFWVLGPLGEWAVGTFLAVGVLMGLGNHVATELSLGRVVTSGEQLTRSEIVTSALVRLGVVTVAALAVAIAFWPVGFTVMIGLALFRLITLVMTGVPLLKELSKV